jgi:N-acyl-L-homoserine lactone synthetase
MARSAFEDAIVELNDRVSVELADTPALRLESFRLRHQVYCVERAFEAGGNGVERDDYDDFALHAVARWRETGEVVGTVRLVLPKVPAGGDDFPLQHVCDPTVLRGLPRTTIGEVSRFALAKQRTTRVRGISPAAGSLLRLALIQGAVRLSATAGHTHWLAMAEPTLLRLLHATGLHFVPVGPIVEYHGLRQPAVAELVPTLARLADEQPAVWDYVTQGGTWYPASSRRRHPTTGKSDGPVTIFADTQRNAGQIEAIMVRRPMRSPRFVNTTAA